MPRAWLALRLFLPLLALRGVTVLITRVRLLHFDKDYNYTASPWWASLRATSPTYGLMEPAAERQDVVLHSASTDRCSWLLLWTIICVMIQLIAQCKTCCDNFVSCWTAYNQVLLFLKRLLSFPFAACALALVLWLLWGPPAPCCFALCARALVHLLVPGMVHRAVCRARRVGSRRFPVRAGRGQWLRASSLADLVCGLSCPPSATPRGRRLHKPRVTRHTTCFVRLLSGASLAVPVRASTSFRDIAYSVSIKSGIPVTDFYLTKDGRVVRLAQFCHEAGVTHDCHLNMCARLLGGGKDGVMRNPKTLRPRSNSGCKQRGAQERHSAVGAAARERAPSFDPWASYAPAQPMVDDDIAMPEAPEPPSAPSRPAGPRRAAWHELSAVDGQFETELATLAFKDLKVDASGLVFARRDQLSEVEGISSKSPLALAIPGHSLKNLPESIVSIPNRITCTLVVMDPSLQRKELKNAMLIPLGAVPIKLKAHSQEDFTPGPTAEVAVLACRSNYEADGVDWPGFCVQRTYPVARCHPPANHF